MCPITSQFLSNNPSGTGFFIRCLQKPNAAGGKVKTAEVVFENAQVASVARQMIDGFQLKTGWIMDCHVFSISRQVIWVWRRRASVQVHPGVPAVW
jgi:hypothetical protein